MYDNIHTIEICEYYIPVVRHALVQRLKVVNAEVEILKISRDRDLTQVERWQLPSNLQKFTQEELQEQVDAWISLSMDIVSLIDQFTLKEK